jgi:hypothetical protein
MKNLFGDDEPTGKPVAVVKQMPADPPAEYTLEDRFKELEDAIEVVAVYAIEHKRERSKVIDRAVKLIERLKKLKG